MDPDGLSILTAVLSGTAMFAFAFWAGAVCADDTERDEQTCLGFSNRLAGLGAVFVLACTFFIWALERAAGKSVLWPILAGVGAGLGCVLCCALGRARKTSAPRAAALFAPIGFVVAAPARLVFRMAHLSAVTEMTEETLLSLVDDVEEQDIIDETQKEMIENIFDLNDVTAGEMMTHRTEVVAVPDSAACDDVVQLAVKKGMSRMPVYHKSMDDIVGFVYVKDLLSLWDHAEKGRQPVRDFLREAMFVPEACRARELLVDFKIKRTQIAVVVDEYGGTSGVVSMEDILEEIVGNIQDEFDDEEEELVRTADGCIASGSADLEDVFDVFELELPEDEERDFDSVGGLVVDRLGRIPAEQESVSVPYGGLLFTVTEVGERRVAKVKCTRLSDSASA